MIQVTDDGPGIAPELTDRVFNAFFTTKAQGSGLGLAIVRKIIDAHDGRIDVLTAPGQGTTFTRDAAGVRGGVVPVTVPGLRTSDSVHRDARSVEGRIWVAF